MDKVIVLGGPTASGKSSLALSLAEELARRGKQAEILCADSITVYRGFEIGAAKPSEAERRLFPHHLLDLVGAESNFTAADFVAAADPLVSRLLGEGKVPIVAGGSGFYLRALLRGMAGQSESPADSAEIKLALEERGKLEGFASLHSELLRADPGSAAIVHPNDHYRIVRALQAMKMHGQPWSVLNAAARNTPPRFPFHYFRIEMPKEELRSRVEKRTHEMLAAGLLAEVRGLLAKGISPDSKPMQSVGYRESLEFLKGDFTFDELPGKIVAATMKLTKAQSTWFKGEELAQPLLAPYLENLLAAFELR